MQHQEKSEQVFPEVIDRVVDTVMEVFIQLNFFYHLCLIPYGLVVRIRRSHRRGPGSIPGVGTICLLFIFFFFWLFSLHSFSQFLSCAFLLFLTPTKYYFLFLSLLISVTLKAMVAALLVFLHSLLDLIMMVHLIFIRLTHQEHIMLGRQLNCNHINLIQLHNLVLSTKLIAIID